MIRAFIVSASLLLLPVAAPAPAQEQGAQPPPGSSTCKTNPKKRRGSSMFGSMLGGIASGALGGRLGGMASYIPFNTFATLLTDAIACRLDEKEQKQAAGATEEAVRGGVGTKSAWTSSSREGVSGSSTVLAQTQTAEGGSCLDVNDVIIVNGEETTVSKRMCRAPGASGYVLAA
jgi:predicted lipid-binding transport protein (Tim44 family)